MLRHIKLIWDFRGPNATKTAAHHEVHLREYLHAEALPITIVGHETLQEMHAIAFLVVTDEHLILVRDSLKPHRAVLYEP